MWTLITVMTRPLSAAGIINMEHASSPYSPHSGNLPPPGPRQGNSLGYKLSKNAISETGVYATKAKRQAKLHPESDICRLTMFFFFPHLLCRIVIVMHCVVRPVFKYPIQLDSWIAHYRTSFCESKMCFKWKHLV